MLVGSLNSQARQASADRAWVAISRFYDHCKTRKPGAKGYPKFQHDNRSVEYKQTGWKLEPDGKHITLSDGCGIGRLRLVGNPKQKIAAFPQGQIKRVRIVHRADGYYVQFAVKAERVIVRMPTGKQVGIDVGLKAFYTDSEGTTIENPRHYRRAEKRLKRLHRQLTRKQKKGSNRKKARKQLAQAHLKVQRQREDFARKLASALVSSHDLIAYEDLQIRNMVKNHHLAKSIYDVGWGTFLQWINYYSRLYGVAVVAVPPQYTSQQCSACGTLVKKSLSVRTHVCHGCGVVLDRDHNAALNILHSARDRTLGHRETGKLVLQNAWGQVASYGD